MSDDYFSEVATARKARPGRRQARLSDYLVETLEPGETEWKPVGPIRRAGNAAGAIKQFFKDHGAKRHTLVALRATSSPERVLQHLAANLGQGKEST